MYVATLCPTLLHFDSHSICVKTLSNHQQQRFFFFFCESDSHLEWASAVNYSSLISLLFSKFQSQNWGSEMQPRSLKNMQWTANSSWDQPGRQPRGWNLLGWRIQKITLTSITTSWSTLEWQTQEQKKAEISSHLNPMRDLTHTDAPKACRGIFDAYSVKMGGRCSSTPRSHCENVCLPTLMYF